MKINKKKNIEAKLLTPKETTASKKIIIPASIFSGLFAGGFCLAYKLTDLNQFMPSSIACFCALAPAVITYGYWQYKFNQNQPQFETQLNDNLNHVCDCGGKCKVCKCKELQAKDK